MKRERETDRNVDGRQGLIKTELHYWSGMRTQKDVFVCLLPPNNKNVHFELSNGQNIMPFLRQINAISYSVKYQSAFYGLQHLVICVWVCECVRVRETCTAVVIWILCDDDECGSALKHVWGKWAQNRMLWLPALFPFVCIFLWFYGHFLIKRIMNRIVVGWWSDIY